MPLLVLFGPPASGKLTIARELSRLTGWKIFHNHLTVDLLLELFEFGSDSFVKLREKIWLEVMKEAAPAGLIFTFAPEKTVAPDFLQRLAAAIPGKTHFVELRCPESEIEARLGSSNRLGTGKLSSVDLYRDLKSRGVFNIDGLPTPARHVGV